MGGAVIGFVISFIIYFHEAWRTFLGALIGALVGAGIGYFIPDHTTMWSTDIMLGLLLLGGAVASSQAAEDLFEESAPSRSRSYVEDEPEHKEWEDAAGYKHDREPVCRCGDCSYFNGEYDEGKCMAHGERTVHSGDYACAMHTMW